MAAAACDRVKLGSFLKHKRSSSAPGQDEADAIASLEAEGSAPVTAPPARSVSQEITSSSLRSREPSLTERWTDSLRKSRDRLRRRFSLKRDKEPQNPTAEPSAASASQEQTDGSTAEAAASTSSPRLSRRDASKKKADVFLKPVRRFGKVASRSAVGKPVVRFAKTCRRDVPKPYLYVRDKIRSLSPAVGQQIRQRQRSDSPRPRSLSPTTASNNDDEIVFAFGTTKEQEEHIYDPVEAPPIDIEPSVEEPAERAEDEFTKFSRYNKAQFEAAAVAANQTKRKSASCEQVPVSLSVERVQTDSPRGAAADVDIHPKSHEPSLKDNDSVKTSRPSSRASKSEDFPKSVRFGKKRVSSDSESFGVRFKPLSTSSSKDEDLGSFHGLQKVRVQLKDDAAGLNLVSKFVDPLPPSPPPPPPPAPADIPPIEIQQLDQPPRVLRPRLSRRDSDEAPPPPAATTRLTQPSPGSAVTSDTRPTQPAPTPAVTSDTRSAGPPQPPPAPAATSDTSSVGRSQPSPEIRLTADIRPPRPPQPSAETLARRRPPLQAIDNVDQPRAAPEPPEQEPKPPREPYVPRIREFCENKRAQTLKPPRKKKKENEENSSRSKSADQANNRVINIFGTASRPARRQRSARPQVRAPVELRSPPPPRPPPPTLPRRPPRSRSGGRGTVSLLDVRELRYVDESATEESNDYRDTRNYRRLLDDSDTAPYPPTRSLRRRRPNTEVTSRLVVNLRPAAAEGSPDRQQQGVPAVSSQPDTGPVEPTGADQEPVKPPRSSRTTLSPGSVSHNETFDSIGEGPGLEPPDVSAEKRSSIASEGPRSLHSFQHEELGSGDELMLLVQETEKENKPPGKPEYAHVIKRSSLIQTAEAEYDIPPPVPKKIGDLGSLSPAVPPRRRPASASPGRSEDWTGVTTWPKRRHRTPEQAPPSTEPAEETVETSPAVQPPPRTVKRNKIRSCTVPRNYKPGRAAARPTLYQLAKEKSQEEAIDMKNRPLPPPPAPPRKKTNSRSDTSPVIGVSGEEDKIAQIVYPVQGSVLAAVETAQSVPPQSSSVPQPQQQADNPARCDSEQNLCSEATEAPSEVTLRSDGSDETLNISQATLTSGRPDPGCESTEEEFFSLASGARPPSQPAVPAAAASVVPASGGQVASPSARHVLVPHFIQRVSTSEMDAASANILDLTAGRIKVTELEVDRIYIREGRVKLIRHEEDSDNDEPSPNRPAGQGGSGGRQSTDGGPPAVQPSGPAGGAPTRQSGQSGGPADSDPSGSDSSDSRTGDPSLLRELDNVERLFQQIGSCLSELGAPAAGRGHSEPARAAPLDFAPGGDSGSSRGSPKRKSAECEDISPQSCSGASGPSVAERLQSIKTTLEQVITPESLQQHIREAERQESGVSGSGGDTGPSQDCETSEGDPDTSDADRIYGIPAADVADAPGRRIRLSQLFASFGKGLKKKQPPGRERRPRSQFYVGLDSSSGTEPEEKNRRNSDPSCASISSSKSAPGTMGACESSALPQTMVAPRGAGLAFSDDRLQYSRVVQEFTDNLASLCKGRAADCCVRPVSEDTVSDSVSVTSEQQQLVTAPQVSDDSDSEDTDTLYTAPDQPPPRPDRQRSFFVAKEMVTSEEKFVDVLKLLNEDFRGAVRAASLEAKSPVIPDADLDSILCHLPELQQLNQALLADLRERIANWNTHPVIADVIVHKGPFLKLYSSYIHDFQAQCHMLEDCRQRYPAFERVCREFEASERCQKLAVVHYMLKPVQRIPQYRLLLEDYLCRLEVGSADYDNTRAALEVVCDVADHANKNMKEGDNFKKLLQLQERLRFTEIVKPGRNFIREGELLKLCRKGPQPRFVILLTDCLLLTRDAGSVPSASSQLQLDYVLPLTGMKVSVPRTDEYQNEFSVVSTTRSFSLTAGSNKERDDWVNALMNAIEKNAANRSTFIVDPSASDSDQHDNTKLGEKAPVWVPDSRASMCQLCTTEFTVTYRRHHCRACGKVVCSSCSGNRAPLVYQGNTPGRVCDACFDTLQKDMEVADTTLPGKSQSKRSGSGTLGKKALRKVPKRLETRVKSYEGVDADLVFQLTHPNQPPLVFHADNKTMADKWVTSLQNAAVLT